MRYCIFTIYLIISFFVFAIFKSVEAKRFIPKTRKEHLERSLRPLAFIAIGTGLALNTKPKKDVKE